MEKQSNGAYNQESENNNRDEPQITEIVEVPPKDFKTAVTNMSKFLQKKKKKLTNGKSQRHARNSI